MEMAESVVRESEMIFPNIRHPRTVMKEVNI